VRVTQDRLNALVEAAEALAGELSLDVVLHTIVRVACVVTHARYSALGIIGEDETITQFITFGADEDTVRAIGHYPTGKGLLGLLIRDPRIIRLEDIAAHPASYGFPPNHPPMSTFLGGPVRSGGRVYGNLYLTEKPGGFTADDEQLLVVLASKAGTAIENAILSERLQSLAVQDERERISRELHDGVIQSLFSIGMGLESARAMLPTHPDRVEERLNGAVDGIDTAIRELRNYIFRLRPHDAAAMGLTRGLAELAREYEVNALVRPSLEVEPGLDARVPDIMVPDLLQIAREALSNAAKHAGATRVTVRAFTEGRSLWMEVADDGAGFIPEGPQVGRGLDNIAERARTLGGRFDVDSSPGAGTVVRVRANVDDRSEP
jgi:signal transduction histidine kinase